MIGKPRPNPDRASTEVPAQRSSGALTGMSGFARARAGLFRTRQTADPALSTVRSAAADAQKSRLPQMAAALSYRTIFGLLPIIIVALVGLKFFASEEDVRTAVEKALEYTNLSAIAVNPEDTVIGPPGPEPEVVAPDDPAVAGVDGENPDAAPPARRDEPPAAVDKWITDLIDRLNQISITAISSAGAVMLIYAAMAMLVEIELAFNQIYRVPRGRSWVRRIMQYWTLLTLGPVALVTTFYIGQKFMTKAQDFSGYTMSPTTALFIGYLTTVVVSTSFFLIAYISVPNTKVRFRPALMGALTAALMWEAGKWGFTQYLSMFKGTAKLYGALSLIPLFLLWVYFTWLIVLFGLQIAYQLQHGRAKTRAQPISDMGPTLVDPAAALVVLSAIARGFEAGKTLDAPALTRATSIPEPVVRLVIGKLAERGLVHRIDGQGDEAEPLYALARPPTNIRVAEILELGYELSGSTGGDEAIANLHRAQLDAVADQSLASLAGLGKSSRLPSIDARPRTDGAFPQVKPADENGSASRGGGVAATLPEPGERSIPA